MNNQLLAIDMSNEEEEEEKNRKVNRNSPLRICNVFLAIESEQSSN